MEEKIDPIDIKVKGWCYAFALFLVYAIEAGLVILSLGFASRLVKEAFLLGWRCV